MSAIQWATVEDAIQQWIVAGSGLASDHVTWAQQTAPRPTGEFISMRLTVMPHAGRDWLAISDNILTVTPSTMQNFNGIDGRITTSAPHGLVTGDGPLVFSTTGTLPAPFQPLTNYWAVVADSTNFKACASFASAVSVSPVVILPTNGGSGTHTVSGTATTVRAGSEINMKLRGPRRAMLRLQCFAGAPTGGGATGTTSPVAVLHDAITSYALQSRSDALNAAGIGVSGFDPVQSIDGIVNTTRFEPRAFAVVHLTLASELVETSTIIATVNPTSAIT